MLLSDFMTLNFSICKFKGHYAKTPSLAYTFLIFEENLTVEDYTSDRIMLSSTLAAIALKSRNEWTKKDLETLSKSTVVVEHNDNNEPVLFAKCAASGTIVNNGLAEALRTFCQAK